MKNRKQTNKPNYPKLSQSNKHSGHQAAAGERIQKVLARGGVGSRREIERWIEEGKLQLNNKQAALGDRLKEGDLLKLNGRIIRWEKFTEQQPRVLIYNKPTGEVVTRNDPEGRPIIFSRLPKLNNGRWIAVGRLDINTQGLILLTNNGELANRLMHPSTEIDREYAVRILGNVSEATLERLQKGVKLEDGLANFTDIQFSGGEGANKWYHVVVTEGRNRLVRRLWESQEITVSRLMRVRYGPVIMPKGLTTQKFHELDSRELKSIMKFVGLNPENQPGTVTPNRPEKSSRRPGSKYKHRK